jgi:hypothetical protein
MSRPEIQPPFTPALPDTPGLPAAVEAIDREVSLAAEFSRDAAYANQLHGAAKTSGAMRRFCAAAQIETLREIREAQLFRHIPVDVPLGNGSTILRPAQNFSEYVECAWGASARVIYEEIQNLEALGSDAFDALNELRISRAQKRLLRSLPDEDRTQIRQAAEAADKDTLLGLIDDIYARQAAERSKAQKAADALTKRAEEAERNYEARGELLKKKDAALNKLEESYRREVQRIETATPDERLALLQDDCTKAARLADAQIGVALTHAFTVYAEAARQQGQNPTDFLSGLVAGIKRTLFGLRDDLLLRDIPEADWNQGLSDDANDHQ